MDPNLHSISFKLTGEEAWAIAQFLKRMRHDLYRGLAESDEDAFDMRSAGAKIREAINQAGFDPR
jgi:hypothetical protein